MDKWRIANIVGLAFGATVLALVNFQSIAESLTVLATAPGYDFEVYGMAVERIGGGMYEWTPEYRHRYPPLFAYAAVPFVWAGFWAWTALHFAVLPLLGWRLALGVLLTFPFWYDVAHGGPMVFALVLAVLTLRGSAWAYAGFLVMALLIPRPLMLPVLAWILWHRPAYRLPTLGAIGVYGLLTVATGELGPFLSSLAGSGDAFQYPSNWGPSRFIGWWGVPLSLALGTWLTWKGRLGLASVAINPYIVPYYWIMLWLELVPKQRPQHVDDVVHRGEDLGVGRG